MANGVKAFIDLQPCARGQRPGLLLAVSLTKSGSQWVMPKHAFNVGKHELLMLLLMVQSERDNRFQFAQEAFIRRVDEFGNKKVDIRPIMKDLFERRP